MRSYTLALIATFVAPFCMSQSVNEVVGHTLPQLNGSARYSAMAGAFGALGGDLTAVSQNPAAGAVFLHSEVGLTGGFYEAQTKTNYFGSRLQQENSNFNINQFGLNLVFNNSQEDSDWKRVNVGFNMHTQTQFSNQYNAQGYNSRNGLDAYFLYYADGIPLSEIELYDNETITDAYQELGEVYGFGAQQAFLGFHAYAINPNATTAENDTYSSNALYTKLFHDYYLNDLGHHRKYSFNVGSVYKDVLFLGANLNLHKIRHQKTESIKEYDYAPNSNLNELYFENELTSYGNGISMQLGAIFNLDNWRLGLSYDSPQWLEINEELQQYVAASHYISGTPYNDIVAPDYINFYEPYQMKLPSKLTASFAYIIGKKGLISVDYSTQNFQNIHFSDNQNSNYFNTLNQNISSTFQSVQQLRLGAEYRIKRISFRGGFFSQQAALKQIDEANTGVTTGLGLDFGNKNLNLALVFQQQNSRYSLLNEGLTDSYNLFEKITQFVISYNLKL